jgi:hypothetical protein
MEKYANNLKILHLYYRCDRAIKSSGKGNLFWNKINNIGVPVVA